MPGHRSPPLHNSHGLSHVISREDPTHWRKQNSQLLQDKSRCCCSQAKWWICPVLLIIQQTTFPDTQSWHWQIFHQLLSAQILRKVAESDFVNWKGNK